MLDKLDRLGEIRNVRLRKRQSEVAVADAARAAAHAAVRAVETEIRGLEHRRAEVARFDPGGTVDAAGFALRERTGLAIDGQMRSLGRKRAMAERGLADREAALSAAKQAARAAERARDQIETVAEWLTREETLEAERQEELQAEPTRVRRPGSGDERP